MNLHRVVAGAIGAINRHESIEVYRNVGTQNVKGKIVATYSKSEQIAQIQAPTESDLKLSERFASAEHRIKVWTDSPIGTINRVKESAGDLIKRADGTYWLVVEVTDDFNSEGWQCLLCVLQTKAPAIVIVEEVTADVNADTTDGIGRS
jgi:hypothetical protein